MKKPSRFVFDALVLTVSGIVARCIAVAFNVYLSKRITTEALGVYQMLMSVYLFGINIAVAGLGLTTIKMVSKEEALGNTDKVACVVKKILRYTVTMGCSAMILFFITAGFLVKNVLNNLVTEKVIYVISASLPFLSVSYALNGYFTAERKVFKSAILQIFDQVSKVIIMIIFMNKFLPGDLENACIALVLSDTVCEVIYCLITLVLYSIDKRRLTHSLKISEEKDTSKEIVKIAFPIAFTACIRSGLNALKQAVIPKSLAKSNMSYNEAMSEYGVVNGMAMPIISFMAVFIQPFSSLLLPQFSEYAAKKDRGKILHTIDKVFSTTICYAICIMGALWTFSKDIGSVLYNTESVGWYIKMLCPLVVFMYLDSTVDSMLRGLDKQIGVMLCNILDLAISISFIYFVVPVMGVKGYIASMFLSTVLNASISIAILIHTVHFDFKLLDWVILPLLCATVASVISSQVIPVSTTYLHLSINLGIYILVYILCYILVKRIREKIMVKRGEIRQKNKKLA